MIVMFVDLTDIITEPCQT